jgi:tyrosyl-tRNA synthetase
MTWTFETDKENNGKFTLLSEVVATIMSVSRTEARRLIKQKAVKMKGVAVFWEDANIMEDIVGEEGWMRIGKKKLFHYSLSADEKILTMSPFSVVTQ